MPRNNGYRENPELRRAFRAANYAQTRPNATNSRVPWSQAEDRQITADDRPTDRELSERLGRSVQAIQIRRSRLPRQVDTAD